METTRRELLIRVGAILLSARWACAKPSEAPLAETWRRMLPEPGAAPIGAGYLAANPTEASAEVLTARILAQLPPGPDSELAARLRAAIRADFERRYTVRLNGWVLSRTECRLSALLELEL